MAGPLRETAAMIAGMDPRLRPGRFRFAAVPDRAAAARLAPLALGSFAEDAGTSLILPAEAAQAAGLGEGPVMACITLGVDSALDGVGLTAAVAGALAARGIIPDGA